MQVPGAKPMTGNPSNACAAPSPARPSPTNASRSTTAGRSCIDSSTPSVTAPPMSCSTPSNSCGTSVCRTPPGQPPAVQIGIPADLASPVSPPLKCRSLRELALCHAPAPISPEPTACSPRTASTATASSPTRPINPPVLASRVSSRAHTLDAAAQARLPHRHRTLWRVWRHAARHRVHRDPLKCRSLRELAHSSRRSSPISPRATPRASTAPAHRRSIRISPNPRPAPLQPCPDCARGCTPAPLRLASRALRSPAPSRHAFLFAGAKSHHPDRDSSALVPISNPTTTGPILPQPSQSTLYSSYPYTRRDDDAHQPAPKHPLKWWEIDPVDQ